MRAERTGGDPPLDAAIALESAAQQYQAPGEGHVARRVAVGPTLPPRALAADGQISGPEQPTTGSMRALGNSVASFLIQVVGKLSTLAGFYIVSVVLPLPDLGFYMLIVALREMLSAVATLGIDVILIRGLTQAPGLAAEKRLLRDAVVIKLSTAVLAGAAMIVAAHVLQANDDLVTGAAIGAGDLVLVALAATLFSYYGSHLRTSSLTGIQTVISALYVGLLLLGAWAGASWLEMLWTRLLTDALLCVAVAFKLGRRLRPVVIQAPSDRWRMFWTSLPLGVVSITILVYTRLDTVLLEHLRGPTEVAYYTVTYKITEAPLIIITSIAATTLPMVSAWSAIPASRRRIVDTTKRALRYGYAAALMIAVVISLFGGELVALLYGPKFASVLPAMIVLIWAMVAMASNIVTAAVLTAVRKTNALMIGAVVNLGLNLVLNLWAIPQWGYFGSAVATTITEGINTAVQMVILCVLLRHARLALPFLLAIAVGGATLTLAFGGFGMLSVVERAAIVGAAVVLLIICRFVTIDDVRRLYRFAMRRARHTGSRDAAASSWSWWTPQ
jgi:O-antigen/teichoic acid export membrane protein